MEVLLEILKYTVPALIVFLTVLVMLRTWSRNEDKRRKSEFNMHLSDDILPVRLQAYERSILLLERISPESMVMRASRSDYNARQLQQLELERLSNKLPDLAPHQKEAIDQSFQRLTNKLLHPPLESLRNEPRGEAGLLVALRRLFQIND